MVAIAVYYFAPFRFVNNQLQLNNSKEISDLLFRNRLDDVTFFELPVNYIQAVTRLLDTAPEFDFVLAIGEDETLKDHAVYEKKSKVEDNTVKNTLRTKYIYENKVYDPDNNFVCNFVNYHMILMDKKCLFVHVPVSRKNNAEIANKIEKELIHQREQITHHTIKAENLPISQHEIGFEKITRVHPNRGKLFTSSKEKEHVMTMKNTYIPLDILFLSNQTDGFRTVQQIEIGIPCAIEPVIGVSFDVLEIPFPYCLLNNTKPGHTVRILEV